MSDRAHAFADLFLSLVPGAEPPPARLPGKRTRLDGRGFALWLDEGEKAPPILRAEKRGAKLFVVGELDAYRGVDTGDLAARFLTDALDGREDAGQLSGHAAVLLVDERERRLTLWTNRLGTFHVYLGGAPLRVLGTYSPAVYTVSQRRLDWEALASFFAAGFFPGDRTHHDDVRVARAGMRYDFSLTDGAPLGSRRTWQWQHTPDGRRDRAETAEAFADRFEPLCRRAARGVRLAVPISGGLDSRSTVAALTRPGEFPAANLWSYSYGYEPHSPELAIARRIARKRYLVYDELLVPEYLAGELDRVLAATEGFVDVTQSRQSGVAARIGERADRVIAAHWGDVWLGDMGWSGGAVTPDAIATHAARKVLKRGRGFLLEHVLRPHLPDGEARVHAQIRHEIDALAHLADPDFRIKAYKTEQWSFRWTMASLRTYSLGAAPRLPFYAPEMIDFFARVPTEQVARRMLQVEYLRRVAPDLAAIEWQAVGIDPEAYARGHTQPRRVRALRKLWRLLTRQPVKERNWERQLTTPAGRELVERLFFSANARLRTHVADRPLRELVHELDTRPSAGTGYAVSSLLSFAAWLERQA